MPIRFMMPGRKTPTGSRWVAYFSLADADGMPGVGSAAIPDDHVRLLGQKIDDLPLAFVAPLQADDAGIAFEKRNHAWMPFSAGSGLLEENDAGTLFFLADIFSLCPRPFESCFRFAVFIQLIC